MNASAEPAAVKSWDWGLALLLLWGVFAPTSLGAPESSSEMVLLSLLLYVFLVAMLVWRYGVNNYVTQAAGLLVPLLPLAFTFAASGSRVAWGKVMFFVMLGAAYVPKLAGVPVTWVTRALFNAVSLVLLGIAAVIVLAPGALDAVLILFYSDYYPTLMPNMLRGGKPVGTFTSHNVAALFYYLFSYVHARAFAVHNRSWNLLLALAFLGVIPFLKSNSGLAFAAFGFCELIYILYKARGFNSKVIGLGLIIGVITGAAVFIEPIMYFIETIVSSRDNGLMGRFASTGNLRGNIDYISRYPFSPVGFQYKSEIFYGDCGYIEMMIRGSLPLLLAAYGGLVSFLRQNLATRNDLRALLVAIFVMEVGFSNLISLRFLLLLPFFIVYLNGLETARLEKAGR